MHGTRSWRSLPAQVNRVDAHRAAITDLCLDADAEWLASSAADGAVHVHNLYGDAEPITLQFDRQVNVRRHV